MLDGTFCIEQVNLPLYVQDSAVGWLAGSLALWDPCKFIMHEKS